MEAMAKNLLRTALDDPTAEFRDGQWRCIDARAYHAEIEKWTNAGLWVICRSDAHYPEPLKRHLKKQAPPILYGIGDIHLLNRGGLAIVGSRNVDAGGEDFTRKAAQACARQGIQVVSGGARGVDEVAMLAALDAGGTVVGVLADSLLKATVAKKYRDHVRGKRLALVTAYSPDARFNVVNAMGRNKQIYALADVALVISAETDKGGTWAGATEELKRHTPRPLFVRDGPDVPAGNRTLVELRVQLLPAPPWDKDLAARLSSKPAAERQAFGLQRTLFGDPAAPSSAAATVKEKADGYQPGRIEPVKTLPEELHEKRSRS